MVQARIIYFAIRTFNNYADIKLCLYSGLKLKKSQFLYAWFLDSVLLAKWKMKVNQARWRQLLRHTLFSGWICRMLHVKNKEMMMVLCMACNDFFKTSRHCEFNLNDHDYHAMSYIAISTLSDTTHTEATKMIYGRTLNGIFFCNSRRDLTWLTAKHE